MENFAKKPVKSLARGLFSHQDRKKPLIRLVLFLGFLVLTAGAALTLAPILWMLLGSFKAPEEIYSVPQTYLPKGTGFENFQKALELVPFGLYFLNSLFICLATVLGQLVVSSLAAYSLSKLRAPFAGFLLLLMMTSLMIPIEVLVIPLYLMMKFFPLGPDMAHVNLINTYWALVLPGVFSAFSIIVLKDHFDSIPNEILYAARVDGCTETGIFVRFVLPMSTPILSILAIFAFVTAWNSFFWPLIVLNNPDFYPLVLGVQKLIDTGEPWNVVMAALTLSTLPSVVLLLIFQRTVIRGIAYTGIYG